jgi:hypothetical protein
VVANELDAERSYVLAKRCSALRAAAASCVITCHRAQIFPAPLHHCAGVFDRIVCDVPCSGHSSPLLQMAVCLEAEALCSDEQSSGSWPPWFKLRPALLGETDIILVTLAAWLVSQVTGRLGSTGINGGIGRRTKGGNFTACKCR